MGLIDRLLGRNAAPVGLPVHVEPTMGEPRASAIQSAGAGQLIITPEDLERAIRAGDMSTSGQSVTPDRALRVASVFACVRILSGPPATMPLDLKRRVSAKVREDADDYQLSRVLKRRPNRWQTPSQFKRMMQAHKLLRGYGVAQIVRSLGQVVALVPLHPDRVTVRQRDDLLLEFVYRKPDGGEVIFQHRDIFYLIGLTLDGVHGVTPLTYARETIGTALSQEQHSGSVARNGNRASGAFKMPAGKSLSEPAYERLKASLEAYRSGGDSEGMTMLFEEGLEYQQIALSAVDAQWIESRKFSRSEIAMFYGVPPHMIGDTEKQTSFGTGLEQQTQGFVTFALEDELTPWEETINRILDDDDQPTLYARFNRAALVRGDLKARKEYYQAALQWGWMNPDEVRGLEDINPRSDGNGERYYDPPNTAGNPSNDPEPKP